MPDVFDHHREQLRRFVSDLACELSVEDKVARVKGVANRCTDAATWSKLSAARDIPDLTSQALGCAELLTADPSPHHLTVLPAELRDRTARLAAIAAGLVSDRSSVDTAADWLFGRREDPTLDTAAATFKNRVVLEYIELDWKYPHISSGLHDLLTWTAPSMPTDVHIELVDVIACLDVHLCGHGAAPRLIAGPGTVTELLVKLLGARRLDVADPTDDIPAMLAVMSDLWDPRAFPRNTVVQVARALTR